MTKLKTLLIVFILCFELYGSQNNNMEIEKIQSVNIFSKTGIKVLKVIDKESIYVVDVKLPNGNRDTVFLTKDKKYLIAGDVIDANSGKKLSMPKDLSILKNKEAFVFGTGSKELILFTDPECPYCKKFESYLSQIKDKVKINVFFFPLSHHSSAYDLSLYIMSQKSLKKKIDTFLHTSVNDEGFKKSKLSKEEKKELEKKLQMQQKLANDLGIQGTPMLFDMDGNKINWVSMLREFGINVQ